MSSIIPILFHLMCSYKDQTMNDFYANQYRPNIHSTEKDDDANANHLYDTAGASNKENDLESKLFSRIYNLNSQSI